MSRVTFLNEPKLSEHAVDAKFNERRIALLPQVRELLENNSRFEGLDIKVTIAHKGVSSLVCILDTSKEKLVLKIPLSLSYNEGEALFLNAWEEAGVKVPHVYDSGRIGEHSHTLMEFIDAPILSDTESRRELIERRKFFEMGQALRKMHTTRASGYGKVSSGSPEFATFREWINSKDMEKRGVQIREHNLLTEEELALYGKAVEVMTEYVASHPESTYCHDDFGTSNIFDTEPITVFDPSPRFNNNYIDVGRALLNQLDKEMAFDQIIEGYFGTDEYDHKVLFASIFISIYIKLPYAHQTKSTSRIKGYMDYLSKNKHLLV
ncbi:MAG: aminoglycoside phosphotransferase family protein [bacterium]